MGVRESDGLVAIVLPGANADVRDPPPELGHGTDGEDVHRPAGAQVVDGDVDRARHDAGLRLPHQGEHRGRLEERSDRPPVQGGERGVADETAVVDVGAKIGAGSRIWHWVHVSAGARIGRNVSLGQNVYVADGAVIGDGCRIQNNVSVFTGVILGKHVFCGPNVVFTNILNPRASINRREEFRETTVAEGVTLGANATILCGTRIGRHAFVGAGAVITEDVAAFALVMGVPGRKRGWVSAAGHRLALPDHGPAEACCPETGARYHLDRSGQLSRVAP